MDLDIYDTIRRVMKVLLEVLRRRFTIAEAAKHAPKD
jgi:uncharacterized protein (DUF2267 family)